MKVLTKWVNEESQLVNDSFIATPIKIERTRNVSFKDEEMFRSSKSPNVTKFEEGSSYVTSCFINFMSISIDDGYHIVHNVYVCLHVVEFFHGSGREDRTSKR